jgi:hypothetical protein
LLDVLRQTARQQGYASVMVETFARWASLYIHFHRCRHPREMGIAEVGQFLESVARTDTAALRAIEEARSSLEFLYRTVLHHDLGELPRPRPPRLLDQVRQVLRVRHYSPRTEECYRNPMMCITEWPLPIPDTVAVYGRPDGASLASASAARRSPG